MTSASSAPPVVTTVLGAVGYAGFGNAANLNTSGYLLGYDADDSGSCNGETIEAFSMSQLNMGNGGPTPWTLEATDSSFCHQRQSGNHLHRFLGSQPRIPIPPEHRRSTRLNLIAAGINPKTAIPSTGPHAFVVNNWYHVAATYDGANIILYWTKVTPNFTGANPISTNAAIVPQASARSRGHWSSVMKMVVPPEKTSADSSMKCASATSPAPLPICFNRLPPQAYSASSKPRPTTPFTQAQS